MDKFYGSLDTRWVSQEFIPKVLLKELNEKLSAFRLCPGTPMESMSKILSREVTHEQAEELVRTCNIDKFKCQAEPPLKLPPTASADSCVSFPITEEGKSHLLTLRILSSSSNGYNNTDAAILLPKKRKMCNNIKRGGGEEDTSSKEVNLMPMQHILLTVRIYHPFQQNYGSKRKLGPVLAQVVNVLGEQPLTTLRDLIFCVNDYAVPGDRSENLDDEITTSNKEIYPSGFFFIGDTFYNDMRNPLSKDYSKVIIDWIEGIPGKREDFNTVSMDTVKVEDLCIRLGYPYVYVHQGSCEHVIVFSDARLINSSDSLISADYPLMSYLYKKYSILCNFCGQYVAIWILHSCNRVPYWLVHLCDRCLRMYCYKNKRKIGKFFLYEYIDPSSISPEIFME